MISPDYFSFRWSWYRPIINRKELPGDRCSFDVRRLPIRMSGRDAGEYIPYAVYPDVERSISASLRKLQDYAIRYMVRGEKVSAHTLPPMDERVRAMVAYLRKQNPHISRDLLHHWCADPKGAAALLKVCEVLWEQGWKQDQVDMAPWVPAVNVLLLQLIRKAIAALPDDEAATTNHVMLCVVGGLYVWALQEFLKHYLEGIVEVARIASYESMMLPATPMVFLCHQPDDSLLADDSRLIRAYGLEAEIVPQMRYLLAKVGSKNEGGILALLAKEKMGNHLLRRTWARLSLWKMAMKTGRGSWMRWVLDAKSLDQLLGGQLKLDAVSLEDLKTHHEEPIADWFLAQLQGGKAALQAGEPWLRDKITLVAFRVFDEDVRVEIARRKAERIWMDRKAEHSERKKGHGELLGSGGMRTAAGGGSSNSDVDKRLKKAWKDGELVLIQPDVRRALHSGKALSLHHGCMRVDWSDYLARVHMLAGDEATDFLNAKFFPTLFAVVDGIQGVFLDESSASGCMMRGPVRALTETGVLLRTKLSKLYLDLSDQDDEEFDQTYMPTLALCLDINGEWTFVEQQHARVGAHRIAFSMAVPQVEAGICRDVAVAKLMQARSHDLGVKAVGKVNVEAIKIGTGQSVRMLHNAGFALTSSALTELTRALGGKASVRGVRVSDSQARDVIDGYRIPAGGLDLLVIQRYGSEDQPPWVLMKAGKPTLAGMDVDVYELLDPDLHSTRLIVEQGLQRWG